MATPDAVLRVRIEAELELFIKNIRKAKSETEQAGKGIENSIKAVNKSFSLIKNPDFTFGADFKKAASILDASSIGVDQSILGINKSFSLIKNPQFQFGVNFQRAASSAGNAAARLSQEVNNASVILGNRSVKSTNQAAFALLNLGRVAQDAPFGFMAIQNNLNPLLESFQSLQRTSGSFGGALKLLGSSLLGPAGIGIGLSVVSSAFLIYQMHQQRAKKGTKELADANKELADSIKDINGVQDQGRKNASDELSKLQSLYGATQNLIIPQAERLKIANNILEKYPTYLEGLDAEGILAGEAATQYEKLSNAILAKGYAQAAEENRQKLINQQLNATVERTKEVNNLYDINKRRQAVSSGIAADLGQEGQIALLGVLGKAAEQSQKKIVEYNKTIEDGANEIKLLDSVVQGLIKDFGTDVIFDPEKTKETKKQVKTIADIFRELNIDLLKVEASVDGTFGNKAKEKVQAFAKAIDKLVEIGIKPTDGVIKNLQERLLDARDPNIKNNAAKFAGIVISNVQDGFENAGPVQPLIAVDKRKILDPFQELDNYIGVELFPKLQSGFENFFNDILEKGTFSFAKLGSAILKTFTSVLASEATQSILNLLNPAETQLQKGGKGLFSLIGGALGAKRVAGAGAATAASGGWLLPVLGGIAAGGLIASLFKKKQHEPAPAFNSYNNNSSNVGSDSFSGGSVVFQISGANLIGVLNRAGARLARYNGTP